MYKVQKVIYPNTNSGLLYGYCIIDDDNNFLLYANDYLRQKANKSINTSRQYAYKLCVFLNYLNEKKQKNYLVANNKDVYDFILDMLYKNRSGIFYITNGELTYNTLSMYLSVINSFYCYLDNLKLNITLIRKNVKNKKSFLYGQIYDTNIYSILDDVITKTKPIKEYKKWYEPNEIEAIMSGFYTLRDKVIFMLTLEGCRIDEALSLRMIDYNDIGRYIDLYKSKGRRIGEGRRVILPRETCKVIDDYIFTERDITISNLMKQGKPIPDSLFINLKNGYWHGKQVSYRNYIDILKGAARRVGLDENKIRTHSGRSTRTMELLYFKSEHPEVGLTDTDIKIMQGWRTSDSMQPYINLKDEKHSRLIAEKIIDSRRKLNEYRDE